MKDIYCSTLCELGLEWIEFRYKSYSLGSSEHNLFWAQTTNNNVCLRFKFDDGGDSDNINKYLSYKSPDNGDWYQIQRDADIGDGHDVGDDQRNLKGDPNGNPSKLYLVDGNKFCSASDGSVVVLLLLVLLLIHLIHIIVFLN